VNLRQPVNRRASAGLFVILLTYLLAWRHQRQPGMWGGLGAVAVLLVLANALTLTLLTSEIAAFCQSLGTPAREMVISLTWVTYATERHNIKPTNSTAASHTGAVNRDPW
jgi:hypothetical protein